MTCRPRRVPSSVARIVAHTTDQMKFNRIVNISSSRTRFAFATSGASKLVGSVRIALGNSAKLATKFAISAGISKSLAPRLSLRVMRCMSIVLMVFRSNGATELSSAKAHKRALTVRLSYCEQSNSKRCI